MLRIVEESVKAVTPHLLGTGAVDWLPDADPQDSLDFLRDWSRSGIDEFTLVTTVAFLALNAYSLLKTGRLFPSLGFEDREHLMKGLFRLKGALGFLLGYFLGSPAINAYYSRVDVQVALGFDIPALKEEAERRQVTRGGEPLGPRESDDERPGGGEGA